MAHRIHCPRCEQTALNRVSVRGIRLDACPHCRGIWFDSAEKELARVLELDVDSLPEPLDEGPVPDVDETAPWEGKPCACPHCGEEMARHWYAAEPGTFLVDTCDEHGVWLDIGELGKAIESLRSFAAARREFEQSGAMDDALDEEPEHALLWRLATGLSDYVKSWAR